MSDRGISNSNRKRRGPADHLLCALDRLADGHAIVARHREKPWASITFEGDRHTVDLAFIGTPAIAAGETFIAELAEFEFAIPGIIVADASIVAVDEKLLPEPTLFVTAELLLLRDA